MSVNVANPRENVVEMVRRLGQGVIDKAEDLVGDPNRVRSYIITLKLQANCVATIECTKEMYSIPLEIFEEVKE